MWGFIVILVALRYTSQKFNDQHSKLIELETRINRLEKIEARINRLENELGYEFVD